MTTQSPILPINLACCPRCGASRAWVFADGHRYAVTGACECADRMSDATAHALRTYTRSEIATADPTAAAELAAAYLAAGTDTVCQCEHISHMDEEHAGEDGHAMHGYGAPVPLDRTVERRDLGRVCLPCGSALAAAGFPPPPDRRMVRGWSRADGGTFTEPADKAIERIARHLGCTEADVRAALDVATIDADGLPRSTVRTIGAVYTWNDAPATPAPIPPTLR